MVGDSEDDNVKAKVKVAVDEFLLGYDYELRHREDGSLKHGLGFHGALIQFARGEDEELARLANKALHGDETVAYDSGGARTASSRFWGVHWHRQHKKWQANYYLNHGKSVHVGDFDDEEAAARARDQAVRDAGLEDQCQTNPVDSTGALVPRELTIRLDRSAVVAPDPARDPTETTSKFWGVTWDKSKRQWKAKYKDAIGKTRNIGRFDTQEEAARAVNKAIRDAGLQNKRRMNPVDAMGALVPKPSDAPNYAPRGRSAVVAPDPPVESAPDPPVGSARARHRKRRSEELDADDDEDLELEPDDVDDFELDADDDEDLELEPDDDDGWD